MKKKKARKATKKLASKQSSPIFGYAALALVFGVLYVFVRLLLLEQQ